MGGLGGLSGSGAASCRRFVVRVPGLALPGSPEHSKKVGNCRAESVGHFPGSRTGHGCLANQTAHVPAGCFYLRNPSLARSLVTATWRTCPDVREPGPGSSARGSGGPPFISKETSLISPPGRPNTQATPSPFLFLPIHKTLCADTLFHSRQPHRDLHLAVALLYHIVPRNHDPDPRVALIDCVGLAQSEESIDCCQHKRKTRKTRLWTRSGLTPRRPSDTTFQHKATSETKRNDPLGI
ncbi:hypothetical protein GQ53DRAFT_2782 [Thozetella sp. PMI_491]|nr:hypothetical protein GQ53DRAFT_2782 [Thozetella sp. PMI_491]